MPSSNPNSPSRRLVLGVLAALPAVSVPIVASVQTATAQAPLPTGAGFSFAAVGDTRPMMYLPLKQGQPDLNKFFVEMFGLVMPACSRCVAGVSMRICVYSSCHPERSEGSLSGESSFASLDTPEAASFDSHIVLFEM